MYVNENASAARGTGKNIMSNVGNLDRIIRFILGAVLIGAPLVTGWPIWSDGLALWGTMGVGVVLVATAAVSFCPIYAALRLSTKHRPT
jgi:hypothetical protein